MMSFNKEILIKNKLKITPQRLAVLDAVSNLKIHPTAENIIYYIKKYHPNIAVGTVYRTLETFSEKNIISKVYTERDVMRYDAVMNKHHHLYCVKTKTIEDYYDKSLDNLIKEYITRKKIPGFKIKDVKIQFIGYFLSKGENNSRNKI